MLLRLLGVRRQKHQTSSRLSLRPRLGHPFVHFGNVPVSSTHEYGEKIEVFSPVFDGGQLLGRSQY